MFSTPTPDHLQRSHPNTALWVGVSADGVRSGWHTWFSASAALMEVSKRLGATGQEVARLSSANLAGLSTGLVSRGVKYTTGLQLFVWSNDGS